MNALFRLVYPSLAMVLVLMVSACGETPSETAPAGMQMPPPPVDVAEVLVQQISDWKEYTGRLQASESIVVMPRTSGYVVEVGFEDGQHVKKGDLLFQIDYRTIEAEVAQLKAEVSRVEAEIELAERDLKRAESLRSSNAISQEQLDNRKTQLVKAKAELDSAKADLRRAQVLHGITKVKAEFDGRVSHARVERGSSVMAGVTVLTTLVSTEKMYAYFDVDERTYIRMQQLMAGKSLAEVKTPVFMSLVGDQDYPYQGQLDFIDNQIDPATGTIRVRAAFSNQHGQFTPGMFVRLKLRIGDGYQGLLIDEKAIGTDLNHKYVLVLGENDVAAYRPVKLGPRLGNLRVIREGLEPGEVIVVSGLQRVRPGTPVTPNQIDMANDEAKKALRLDRIISGEQNGQQVSGADASHSTKRS